MRTVTSVEIEQIEIDLLLEGILRRHGFDFREYARASLTRRIRKFLQSEGFISVSALQDRLLRDPACFQRFILTLTVTVTEMFRDPEFWLAFRAKVVPLLRPYPFIRLWSVGCSTGEEPYSLAILLEEEGLLSRCRIYATDLNESVLRQASEGLLPESLMQSYSESYLKAGGKRSLADYYTVLNDKAALIPEIKKNVVFAQHNLVTDRVFNEFHAILCRNVMIYFVGSLQNRVHNLLYDSLIMFGVLGLGDRESLTFTPHQKDYEPLGTESKIYRKIA